MKSKEKQTATEQKTQENSSDNVEAWSFILAILFICITLVFTTRMYVDGHLIDRMIDHYTLRGKEVIVKDEQLIFVN